MFKLAAFNYCTCICTCTSFRIYNKVGLICGTIWWFDTTPRLTNQKGTSLPTGFSTRYFCPWADLNLWCHPWYILSFGTHPLHMEENMFLDYEDFLGLLFGELIVLETRKMFYDWQLYEFSIHQQSVPLWISKETKYNPSLFSFCSTDQSNFILCFFFLNLQELQQTKYWRIHGGLFKIIKMSKLSKPWIWTMRNFCGRAYHFVLFLNDDY